MKTYIQQTANLNEAQKQAVEIRCNAVIAAGAGSGKTKVLASRFLHLITQKKIPVDEILALTFTRKAAAEMRTRIYSTLMETAEDEAKEAAASFFSARIETIDSFCASICRDTCRSYGVTPDFTIDDELITVTAEKKALEFILQNRTSEAVRSMLKKFALKDLPSKLFVEIMKNHSSISSPLDFKSIMEFQYEKIKETFITTAGKIIFQIEELRSVEGQPNSPTWQELEKNLKADFSMPDINNKKEITAFIKNCIAVNKVPNRLKNLKEIKTELAQETDRLLSLANYILNENIIRNTFELLSEFQIIFNDEKRKTGVLTFRDISQMAVDALKDDRELRSFYKNSFKSIMIDEFQDNNSSQRDLLYLISENDNRNNGEKTGIPSAENLTDNKLFFVGDEKQSIYLFRGADVSVFRKLRDDLCTETEMPELSVNYRTEKYLLELFNAIFPHIFLTKKNINKIPEYEAEFIPIDSVLSTKGCKPGFEILLLDENRFKNNSSQYMDKTDSEAEEVSEQIRKLVDEDFQVRDELSPGGTRSCTYNDIAILFRSTAKQRQFERHLRNSGIPYQSEAVSGLFSDAPANDIYAFLRLAVNPEDTYSYMVVLHSPFVSADDETFTRILLSRAEARDAGIESDEPFSEKDLDYVSPSCSERFKRAGNLYKKIKENTDSLPITQLVSKLWFDYGYRYNLICESDLLHYTEIYDYIFELARQADAKSLSLAEFLDVMEEKNISGEKFDEIDIPSGRKGGVHLMTIHKSKGLEFPVVFIVNAGNKGRTETNDKPFYFSKENSITINTEAPDELQDVKGAAGNFFYNEAREENNAKIKAEIRRLLYVAVTRAEIKIFISGSYNLNSTEYPTGPRTENQLRQILEKEIPQPDKAEPVKISFFDLLLPAVLKAGEKASDIRITEVLPKPETSKKHNKQKNIEPSFYDSKTVNYKIPEQKRYTASTLHELMEKTNIEEHSGIKFDGKEEDSESFLDSCGIDPADFGTYVHAVIESEFTGKPAGIPNEIYSEAKKMADSFFASGIGIAAKTASWKKIEYGFLARIKVDGLPEDSVISGKMDLVFESKGNLFIVDYKTDRIEKPDIHKPQLKLYAEAAKRLFAEKFPNAKIIPVIYYLRTGHTVEIN